MSLQGGGLPVTRDPDLFEPGAAFFHFGWIVLNLKETQDLSSHPQ